MTSRAAFWCIIRRVSDSAVQGRADPLLSRPARHWSRAIFRVRHRPVSAGYADIETHRGIAGLSDEFWRRLARVPGETLAKEADRLESLPELPTAREHRGPLPQRHVRPDGRGGGRRRGHHARREHLRRREPVDGGVAGGAAGHHPRARGERLGREPAAHRARDAGNRVLDPGRGNVATLGSPVAERGLHRFGLLL